MLGEMASSSALSKWRKMKNQRKSLTKLMKGETSSISAIVSQLQEVKVDSPHTRNFKILSRKYIRAEESKDATREPATSNF